MPKCAWDTNYQKLEQFAKEHGHCNVPFSGEFRHLAKWATRIKNKYKTKPTSVTQTQLEKLNRIGFDWSSQKDKDDQHWNEMYQRLVSFKAKTGHCSVPIGYVRDKELGNWVANQRKRASQNKLRQDRKDILQKIQFSWSLNKVHKKKIEKDYTKHEEKWNAMFQKLKRYECQHGDSQVAYNYPEDPALGMWVSTQRRVYNKRTYMYGDQKEMHQSRKDLLDSIAFDFFPQPPGNNDSQKETFVHQSSDDGSSDDDEGKIFAI